MRYNSNWGSDSRDRDERRGGQSNRSSYGRREQRYGMDSGYDDDDDNRGSGWYGDSRGHSEAAQRGWEHRGGGRDYDNDDHRNSNGYRSGGSSGGNNNGGDGRGWYGDSRGHSEAAQRGWENRGGGRDYDDEDRGGRGGRGGSSYGRNDDEGDGRGWYGDSRGHSEAAQLGWEHRGQGRSNSGSYGGRNGNNGRGGNSGGNSYGNGRGQGAWFGDSEGHSRAARQGWEQQGNNRNDYDDKRGRGRRR